MAGRGTDILLGGNLKFLAKTFVNEEDDEEAIKKAHEKALSIVQKEKEKVVQLGGLHVLGTERHEARRIDNQLRGRAGRQGDPGSSRFYLSLEDDLLRIFGSERISHIMDRLGMEEDQPIEHGLVTKAIENAQRRVEAHNFEIRKHLLEYDNVMNQQREVIYSQRREVLTGEDLKESVMEIVEEQAEGMVDLYAGEKEHPEDWDLKGLQDSVFQQFSFRWSAPLWRGERLKSKPIERTCCSEGQRYLLEEGGAIRSAHASVSGEGDHAPSHRPSLERPSPCHRSVKGRDRIEGLWAEGPKDRISEGSLSNVP